MTRGFILGKFYPLHLGHIGMIEFAQKQCDELIILISASDKETINGSIRLIWLQETFMSNPKIKPSLLNYFEEELPNTSIPSKEVSQTWAFKIQEIFPNIDIVFSSEKYGVYVAEFLHCRHISFDPDRIMHKISASEIRKGIFKHWGLLFPPSFQYYSLSLSHAWKFRNH